MTATDTSVPAATATGAAGRRPARVLRLLPAVTLIAVLTITASAEYELARTVLGLPPHIAWALPVAVDSYALAALRSGRDVPAALTVMAGALAASMGAHLAVTRQGPDAELPAQVVAPAATAIMTVLVVVAWRVHVLIDHHADSAPSSPPVADTPTRADTPAPSTPARADTPAPASTPRPAVPAEAANPASPPRQSPPAVLAAPDTPTPLVVRAPAPSASLPDASDAEILAAIVGRSPGVRALMRTHGIGQARATRLHRRAVTEPPPTSSNNQDNHHENEKEQTQNTEKSQENNHMSEDENRRRSNTTKINNQSKHQHQEEQSKENDQKPEQESDTGITDRVGHSRSTSQAPEMLSGANSAAAVAPC